jgi:enoyl-CoA hydratase
MMERFAALMAQLSGDDDLRVLIITGAGERAFCSGGDLHELGQHPSADDAHDFITLMGDALLQMEQLPVPVIAAMNGYALGGGSEIALACDMRIADAHIKMGMVQVQMALTPGWGAGQRLLRLVGYSQAMELLLRGDVLRAGEVQSLGLVNRLVDGGQALPAALEFARQIADRPPAVVRGIKTLLQAGLNQPYEQALQTERAIFPPLWADDPHLKAVAAFLERQREK